eukprot:m.7571 g.7571  ORF g.7571 m.7571 type:complete len:127 (-) comp6757_c0_seq1:302-682(-)
MPHPQQPAYSSAGNPNMGMAMALPPANPGPMPQHVAPPLVGAPTQIMPAQNMFISTSQPPAAPATGFQQLPQQTFAPANNGLYTPFNPNQIQYYPYVSNPSASHPSISPSRSAKTITIVPPPSSNP